MTKLTRRPSTASVVGNEVAQTTTDIIMAEDRAIVQRTGGKVSEEQYRDALDRLACGDTMANVTADLGVSRSALLVRANENEEFQRLLTMAHRMGVWARLENAENMILCGNRTTGSIERDKAYMDYAKWMASKLFRDTFGDRLQVDQRQMVIHLPGDLDGF